jgi:hypothetical protein
MQLVFAAVGFLVIGVTFQSSATSVDTSREIGRAADPIRVGHPAIAGQQCASQRGEHGSRRVPEILAYKQVSNRCYTGYKQVFHRLGGPV